MKRIALLAVLGLIAGPLVADPDAGLAALRNLGQANGQALACSQMDVARQSKSLMIKHAPKTRRYGEIFEDATNAAYLEQGKDLDKCPQAAEFASRLADLSKQLQATLPAAQ